MPKYEVIAVLVVNKYIGTFEAKDEEEAIKIAEKEGDWDTTLCHQCSSQFQDHPEVDDVLVWEKQEEGAGH